jgi:hypothetical protein
MIGARCALRRLTVCQLTHKSRGNGGGLRRGPLNRARREAVVVFFTRRPPELVRASPCDRPLPYARGGCGPDARDSRGQNSVRRQLAALTNWSLVDVLAYPIERPCWTCTGPTRPRSTCYAALPSAVHSRPYSSWQRPGPNFGRPGRYSNRGRQPVSAPGGPWLWASGSGDEFRLSLIARARPE